MQRNKDGQRKGIPATRNHHKFVKFAATSAFKIKSSNHCFM